MQRYALRDDQWDRIKRPTRTSACCSSNASEAAASAGQRHREREPNDPLLGETVGVPDDPCAFAVNPFFQLPALRFYVAAVGEMRCTGYELLLAIPT